MKIVFNLLAWRLSMIKTKKTGKNIKSIRYTKSKIKKVVHKPVAKAAKVKATKAIKPKKETKVKITKAKSTQQPAAKKTIRKSVVKSNNRLPKVVSHSAKKVERKVSPKPSIFKRILTAEGWKRMILGGRKPTKS